MTAPTLTTTLWVPYQRISTRKKVEELIDFVKENPQASDRLTDLMKTTGVDLNHNLSIEQLRNVNQVIFKGFGDPW